MPGAVSIPEQRFRNAGALRLREMVALSELASHRDEHRLLVFGLDAFGDDGDVKGPS